MKAKEIFENEILSDLKRLEEEYEEMMYFNNFPPDISIIPANWIK